MAVALACGPGALLSHRSAAALSAVRESAASRIEVSSSTRRGYTADAIRLHRLGEIADADRAVRVGIPSPPSLSP